MTKPLRWSQAWMKTDLSIMWKTLWRRAERKLRQGGRLEANGDNSSLGREGSGMDIRDRVVQAGAAGFGS